MYDDGKHIQGRVSDESQATAGFLRDLENSFTVPVNSSPKASPPKCLVAPSKKVLTEEDLDLKMEAAMERRRSISEQKRERCRGQVERAKEVARANKEGFNALLEVRRVEIEESLEAASRRRSLRNSQSRGDEVTFDLNSIQVNEYHSPTDTGSTRSSQMMERSAKKFSPKRRLFHEHPTETPIRFSPVPSPASDQRGFAGVVGKPKSQRRLFAEDDPELLDTSDVADAKWDVPEPLQAAARFAAARMFLSQCHVSREHVDDFDEMTKQLRTKKTLLGALRVLRLLKCHQASGKEASLTSARILLSAFMISNFSEYVMDPKGDSQDRELLHTARLLVAYIQFGSSLSRVQALWKLWREGFDTWKKRDAEKILRAMIQDAVATEYLRDSVIQKHMSEEEVEQWNEQLDGKMDKIREAVRRIAGEEGVSRLDSALSGAKMALNEELVHEITLDAEGLVAKLTDRSGLEAEIDLLRTALRLELAAQPPVLTALRNVERDIQADLRAISGQVVEMEPIQNVRDVDAMRTAIRTACAYIRELQEPSEDTNLDLWVTRAMEEVATKPAEVVAELRQLVGDLRKRVTKAKILALAPTIQINGVQYENARFQEQLSSGVIASDLPNTKTWLRSLILDAPCLDVQGVLRGKHSSCEKLLRYCIASTVDSSVAFSTQPLPEVLHLDVERIEGLQNDLQRSTLLACIYHLCLEFVRRKSTGNEAAINAITLANVSEKLKTLHWGQPSEVEEALIESTDQALNVAEQSLTSSEKDLVRSWIHSSARENDHLFQVLRKRVGQKLRDTVLESGGGGHFRVMELEAFGFRRNGGGAEVASEAIGRTNDLARHAWAVHGTRIRDQMRQVLEDAGMMDVDSADVDEF